MTACRIKKLYILVCSDNWSLYHYLRGICCLYLHCHRHHYWSSSLQCQNPQERSLHSFCHSAIEISNLTIFRHWGIRGSYAVNIWKKVRIKINQRKKKIKGTFCKILVQSQDSTVSIVTRYELDGLGIESRWGVKFSAPFQTSPGAHPASCMIGTSLFPRGKSLGA